ncbi:MAG: YHS domain-containing (seleno)protein [Bacteroidota bacterium]
MKKSILIIALVSLIAGAVHAQNISPIDDNGLAVGGYDVVAYFSNKAVKGNSHYSADHNGVTYHFSSNENKETFEKNPTQYLPQFGGYCAWGVAAKDAKFPINPETFDIIDGKLYLFFNGDFNGQIFNTVLLWNAETSKLQADAHKKWPTVKNK